MAIPFKKNNPGCPCCGQPECPCACYAFDDNAEDSSVNNLHLTSTSASLSDYTTGKLGKAFKHTGSQHHEHAHDDCFTPSVGDGLAVWFWLKVVTAPSTSSDWQGIVTKGRISSTPVFTGEWGIFWKTPPGGGASGPSMSFVYNTGSGPAKVGDLAIGSDIWYFFHWSLNTTDAVSTLTAYNSNTDEEFGGDAAVIVGEIAAVPAELMRVGNNTDGEILGANSGEFLIDNLGFCKDIGTEAEMEERAENLYNSGDGRACNHAGYEGGGCCA